MSSDAVTLEKVRRKSKRAERALHNKTINNALESIDHQLHEIVQSTADDLDISVDEIRSEFLAYASIRSTAHPTAWNGLIHEKSIDWSEEKDNYPGGAFMHYVVERIKSEGLYENMDETEKEYYKGVAQEARDAKLNAGSTRTTAKRLVQGTAKERLEEIAESLDRLHNVTGIEFALFAVRGNASHGLKPQYFASKTASTFFESHLSVSMDQLVTLMESAALGGAPALLSSAKSETSQSKTLTRQVMLESLRDAATSVAPDGALPFITDRQEIRFVEWSNHHKMVESYGVISFGWPLSDSARMMLPNGMGLAMLHQLLQRIRAKQCGFRRMGQAEAEAWLEQFDGDVAAGIITIEDRKRRSDAGKPKVKRAKLKDQQSGTYTEPFTSSGEATWSTPDAAAPTHNTPAPGETPPDDSPILPVSDIQHVGLGLGMNTLVVPDSQDGSSTATASVAIPEPALLSSSQIPYAKLVFRQETAEKIIPRAERSASRSCSRSRTPTTQSGRPQPANPSTPLGLHNTPFEQLIDPAISNTQSEHQNSGPRRSQRLRK
ncbi:hypothetical protein RhiLY_12945 [Ceratobasidium sp. AG-Ba]|nr:hypothetical protein RhiLY_12945 [Ceratobasidium sp. AG-Ba]